MITFFATARPFRGHMRLIQTNALRSWLELCPPCETILLGRDEGSAEIAQQFGLRHIAEIECNEFGTPLINSLFQTAEQVSVHDVLCQINADIMITDDFLPAIETICSRMKRFLVTGQRWDLDVREPWDFDSADWQRKLADYAKKYGTLHPPTGLDYFVFPKGLWGNIPPFAIGRRVLDNWLIYRARTLGVPVIDASAAITAIHQNHDYSFHPLGERGVMEGEEVDRNLKLADGWSHVFTLLDATHLLTARGLFPAVTRKHLRRRWEVVPVLHPRLVRPYHGLNMTVTALLRAARLLPRRLRNLVRGNV